MSNRVDFFPPQNDSSSLIASTGRVYIDGQYFDEIEVASIVFSPNPDFNKANLSYYAEQNHYLPEIRSGQSVTIKTIFDCGTGRVLPEELDLFTGFIEQIQSGMSAGKCYVKITACDSAARLSRKTVFGRSVLSAGDRIWLSDLDTVFNSDGEPNASAGTVRRGGREYRVFAADDVSAGYFSCAEAIYYLLCEHITYGRLAIPPLSQLEELCGEQVIYDVDVTGMGLTEAIEKLCDQAGLKFRFTPTHTASGASEAIVFYLPGQTREVQFNCQNAGETISLSKTNIIEIATKQTRPIVTNRYTVQGDFKMYEATFDLTEAWDSSLEGSDYDKFSMTANENFYQVRDVYRKWSLNEAGDYSGEAFDFSDIFENEDYIQKRRRFLPCVTANSSGTSLGYQLQVSYTGGINWWPYSGSFDLLLDECGIWLSGEELGSDVWFAILKGLLKFRITASVISDRRISHCISDGPVNAAIEVVDEIATLPSRFKYRKISPYSIFYESGDENITAVSEADDSDAIVELARKSIESLPRQYETIEIKTPVLINTFQPGDTITSSPDSRDLLSVSYNSRSLCYIEKVEADFKNQQTTITAFRKRI